MPRALITGITGQDGSLLGELLVAEGLEVVGLARDPAAAAGHENLAAIADAISIVPGDLLDQGSLRRAVAEVEPDELYHVAAPSFVPASWDDPEGVFAAIANATGALLAEMRGRDGARTVVFASGEVFGDSGESPQRESSPMRPMSPYGIAKLAALHLTRINRERYGIDAGAAIAFNHESERRPQQFVTRKVTRAAAAISLGLEHELLLGDLDARRDWAAARDVVRGVVLMARAPVADDYVFATGRTHSVRELVNVAFAAAGIDAAGHVKVDPALVRPPERTAPVGDASRARAELGWQPTIGFDELIAGMVEADRRQLAAQSA